MQTEVGYDFTALEFRIVVSVVPIEKTKSEIGSIIESEKRHPDIQEGRLAFGREGILLSCPPPLSVERVQGGQFDISQEVGKKSMLRR